MKALNRIRWHCRRGTLELDLLLERFNRDHLPRLSADQTARYADLLALQDHELLDLLMGRGITADHFADLQDLMSVPPSRQSFHV